MYTIGEVNVREITNGAFSISEGFINGFASNTSNDIDGDGVLNELDNCPNTPLGSSIDANGCLLLDSNNFNIETIAETCIDKDNGQIIINALASYTYRATINGSAHEFTESASLTIDNLAPGDYEICIEVTGQTSPYCYNITIDEGVSVSGKTSTISNRATVEIFKGTAPYDIFVNGEIKYSTMSSNFDIDVEHGDFIEVRTNKSCEGVYSKTIELFDVINVYPNPTSGLFDVAITIPLKDVAIEIYNYNAQLISSKSYEVKHERVQLDISDKPSGFYIVKIGVVEPVSKILIKD